MKQILSLLLVLLILPVATASLEETFANRVTDMNAQAGPYLSKASLALPVDIEIQATDTQESIVIQANKEGIVILSEVKKPDVYVRGTNAQLDTFNKEYMPVNEFLAAFGSLELEGNTIKGKIALKVANKIIEEKVAEIRAREAAAANPTGYTTQIQQKQPGFFNKIWLTIVNIFNNLKNKIF